MMGDSLSEMTMKAYARCAYEEYSGMLDEYLSMLVAYRENHYE